MRVKGDGIFSINTSATGGFGSAGISLPEAVVEAGGGGLPITTNLEIHMDAGVDCYSDEGVTLCTNTDPVRRILDQSGNNNTLNQATASSQLTWTASDAGVNNLPVLECDTTDFMTLTNNIVFDAGFSFYFIAKKNSTTGFIMTGTAFNNRWIGSNYTDGNTSWLDDSQNLQSLITTHFTDYKVRCLVWDSVNDDFILYENGVETAKNTNAENMTDNTTLSTFFNRASGSGTGASKFAEMLFYKGGHDASQVATMSSYFNDKYALYS